MNREQASVVVSHTAYPCSRVHPETTLHPKLISTLCLEGHYQQPCNHASGRNITEAIETPTVDHCYRFLKAHQRKLWRLSCLKTFFMKSFFFFFMKRCKQAQDTNLLRNSCCQNTSSNTFSIKVMIQVIHYLWRLHFLQIKPWFYTKYSILKLSIFAFTIFYPSGALFSKPPLKWLLLLWYWQYYHTKQLCLKQCRSTLP